MSTHPPASRTSAARHRHLMEKAAEALEDGRSPLDRSFLIENSVTSDECFSLADGMAAGIRLALVMIGPRLSATATEERGEADLMHRWGMAEVEKEWAPAATEERGGANDEEHAPGCDGNCATRPGSEQCFT